MRAWLLALGLAAGAASAQQPPIVVGAAVPETGQLADLGAQVRRGLELWRDGINARGGLLGRAVALRLIDDRSEASASLHLYQLLIDADRVDLLVGPLGSAATIAAAATVERAGRVMLNISGVTSGVQRDGRASVFQVPAPLTAYAEGPLAMLEAAGYRTLQVVARSDPRSREAADHLGQEAKRRGLQAVVRLTPPGTTDYAAEIAAARARNAEAWISFGIAEDAAEMVKSFKRLGYAPWLFLAQGVADPAFVRQVGQDAEFALGLAAYEPGLATPANEAFVAAWRAQWKEDPGELAAHAYAGGLVLEAAVRKAGSVSPAALRAALLEVHPETPVGRYAVNASGAQTGIRPVVIQILRGRREVVWPPEVATAKWRIPYPRWDERQPYAPEPLDPVYTW
ncbi:MAG TPA: ABC transporter substrate-binding protein [Burkholderiales bacterium]|nr:ABC transporter substrate-binding protein [Burkholderiales bacterium]